MMKVRERLINVAHTGTGQVSISAHLQGTDFSFRFKYRKNWSRGKRYE
jgi:hypothetical protein